MSDNLIKIVIPQATTNLVTNPSVETDLTGWSSLVSAVVTRTNAEQRWGRYSVSVGPISSTGSGVAYGTISGVIADDLVASAWVKATAGASGSPMEIVIWDATSSQVNATQSFTLTTAWQRVEVHSTTNPFGNNLDIYIRKTDASATGVFYVDGLQFEVWTTEGITTATTYCDGDRPGCEWTGIVHASTSTRSRLTRAGGKLLAIDASTDMKRLFMDGFGMTRYAHLTQDTPLLPGAILQGSHAEPRVLTMVMKSLAGSRSDYHAARQKLINYLKHHATPQLEPVLIRYDDTREVAAYYDGGLEGLLEQHYKERFVLRFVCYDPYWREVGEHTQELGPGTAFSTNYIVMRKDGSWDDVAGGVNARVRAIAYHVGRKTFFVGGDFTLAGGSAANYIAEYDPVSDSWSALGSGLNAKVNTIAISPAGKVYVGGAFTTAGGASANRIAEWDPAASAWSAIDTGADGEIFSISIGERNIWAGGDFTVIGGATANRVAYWDGQNWNTMDSGANGTVYSVDVGPAGVVVAGTFTTVGAAATIVNRIAKWDTASGVWEALGAGMNNGVNRAIWEPNTLRIYATGSFTQADNANINRIAVWNGTAWVGLGNGLNNEGATLAWGADGSLYVGGDFSAAGGDDRIAYVGRWISGSWVPLDIQLPVTTQRVDAISIPARTLLALGYRTAGTVGAPTFVTVTNGGTARAWPQIVVKGTLLLAQPMDANIRYIRNETTGHELFLDLDMLNEEEIVIDLDPVNKRVFSDFRDNLVYAVQPASDFAEFHLAPGANDITLYVTGTLSSLERYMKWRDTYESID